MNIQDRYHKMNKKIVCLIVTEQCNLRCSYCYIKQSPEIITKEVIDQTITFIIDMIEQSPNGTIQLDVFGGEALIQESKVRYIIEQVEQRVKKEYLEKKIFNVTIFTNCILLSEDFLKFTRQRNFVKFNFSIDGNRDSHDCSRCYGSGNGSYQDAMKGLETYAKVYGKDLWNVGIRWTLSPQNVMHLADSARFLMENGANRITPYHTREGWTSESLRVLDEQMAQLTTMFTENIDNGVLVRSLIAPMISDLYTNGRARQFCGAGADHISVSPTGLIYPCARFYTTRTDEFILGNVYDGIDESNKWRIFFKNYTEAAFPKCANCDTFRAGQCEGQCIAAMYEEHKSLTEIRQDACGAHKIVDKYAHIAYEVLKDNPNYQKALDPTIW